MKTKEGGSFSGEDLKVRGRGHEETQMNCREVKAWMLLQMVFIFLNLNLYYFNPLFVQLQFINHNSNMFLPKSWT